MLRLTVLLLIFLISGVSSECACYEQTDLVGRSAPITNAYNHDTFGSCYTGPCSFKAYAGNDDYRWTRLTMQWGTTTNSNGLVEIFDGQTDNATILVTVNEGEHVLDGSAKSLMKSSTPYIFIKYSQTGNDSNIYYGVIKALPASARL